MSWPFNHKRTPPNPSLLSTLIGKDTEIVGTLRVAQSIRIEGRVEGEIIAKGDVHVGENGRIAATITAKRVFVSGQVLGEINVTNGLEILKTGRVTGKVNGDSLVIEPGAVYEGEVNMTGSGPKSLPIQNTAE